MTTLFDPIRFGDISATNRIVMAPLTRNRAGTKQVPTALMAKYYEQRATAGMIIAEATQISPEGQGYLDTPGIYSAEQKAAWQVVTDAVHAQGGKIVLQLWHVGRISHVSLQPDGQAPVSSTARRADAKTFTKEGFVDVSTPRALRLEELPRIVEEYRQAARSAVDAGFDGVEVHSANGYLLEQFLRDSINDRTDIYGGCRENRTRFPLEVIHAVVAEIGASRTGVRISPVTPANDAPQDSDAQGLFNYYVEQLAPLKLAFVHVIEGATGGARDVAAFDYEALRHRFKAGNEQGAWIVNNGYTRAMAIDVLAHDRADMVAFGRPFISNPDLVNRLRLDAPLAAIKTDTLYGGSAAGYIDYPPLEFLLADNLSKAMSESYEFMLKRAQQKAREGSTSALNTIAELRSEVVALYKLSEAEFSLLETYVKRDLTAAAAYLNSSGKELKNWLGFDVALLKYELWQWFSEAADQTTIALKRLKEKAAAAGYKSGEVVGLGTLVCDQCKQTLQFLKPGHIPPCPKCNGTHWHRQEDVASE